MRCIVVQQRLGQEVREGQKNIIFGQVVLGFYSLVWQEAFMPAGNTIRSIDTLLLPTQQSLLVLQHTQSSGIEPAAILRGTGLSLADLEDDDTWISYRHTMQIIENAYRLTGDSTLGLEVGTAEDISTFGILGYAMLSCATVREALKVGEKYQRTAQNLCDVKMLEDQDKLCVHAATPFVLTVQQYHFAMEELFAGVMEIIRTITGENVYPDEVRFSYAKPEYAREYNRVFSCPVVFNSSGNTMVLGKKVLELPVLQANKFNAKMSEKLCQEITRKYVGEEGLATRIRHIILSVPGEFPSEAAVADALAVSGRTMRRQLGDLGTSFRDLLNQVRSDLAEQYLRNSTLSVEQIAQLLGYTETTNFRRAFNRWLGMSPREYRLSHLK